MDTFKMWKWTKLFDVESQEESGSEFVSLYIELSFYGEIPKRCGAILKALNML
jgi:hypothetical protein